MHYYYFIKYTTILLLLRRLLQLLTSNTIVVVVSIKSVNDYTFLIDAFASRDITQIRFVQIYLYVIIITIIRTLYRCDGVVGGGGG